MNFSFCICELAINVYLIYEIQQKRKSKNNVQCPLNDYLILEIYADTTGGINKFSKYFHFNCFPVKIIMMVYIFNAENENELICMSQKKQAPTNGVPPTNSVLKKVVRFIQFNCHKF